MIRTLLPLLLAGFLVAGCAQEPMSPAPDGSRLATQADFASSVLVGTGSGDLFVDGDVLGIKPGDVIAIKGGTYSSITIQNLNGLPALPLRLIMHGLVEVVGGAFELKNSSYLTVNGGPYQNLFLHDIPYRGIIISGSVPHSVTLQGIRAKNIGDYALYYSNPTTYKGSDATACTDFKLLFCDFENVGGLQFRGDLNQSGGLVNYGMMKNPELAYCTFRNIPTAGVLVFFGNAENANIHHNWLNNINSQNNNHNGIFLIKGNGNVHHNKCTNHQGNFVRFWPFSQGIIPRDVSIHDNIVWNSRKYSGLEVQSFAESMIRGVSTYCNTKVYNNTVGRMNTDLPTVYVGVVVDVYNLYGGDLQIFNNLSFEQKKSPANDGIWSQQGPTKPSLYTNNLNFGTSETAGLVDRNYFRLKPNSLAKNRGLYRPYEVDDFYNTTRSYAPSIGAVD